MYIESKQRPLYLIDELHPARSHEAAQPLPTPIAHRVAGAE